MKYFMAVVLALSVAAPAFAADNHKKMDLSTITEGNSDQTPYQKVKALYDQAAPMKLSQFISSTDPVVKNGNCVAVKENFTGTQPVLLNTYPARVKVKTVITPAVPATPSEGPLFPGTPGKPEKDAYVDIVLLVPNDGSLDVSDEDLTQAMKEEKFTSSSSPGYSQTFLHDNNDAKSWVTSTYRTLNGLIVVKQASNDAAVTADIYDYFYCYQQ